MNFTAWSVVFDVRGKKDVLVSVSLPYHYYLGLSSSGYFSCPRNTHDIHILSSQAENEAHHSVCRLRTFRVPFWPSRIVNLLLNRGWCKPNKMNISITPSSFLSVHSQMNRATNPGTLANISITFLNVCFIFRWKLSFSGRVCGRRAIQC